MYFDLKTEMVIKFDVKNLEKWIKIRLKLIIQLIWQIYYSYFNEYCTD